MSKYNVLFVCVHNSARSQMAEALLRKMAGDKFEVESAGLEPGKLNPLAVEVMKETGVDISRNKTRSVFDMLKQNKSYDYIITVCDESQAGSCPIFPGGGKKLHWSFEDPSSFQGSQTKKLARTREVRDEIKKHLEDFVKEIQSG